MWLLYLETVKDKKIMIASFIVANLITFGIFKNLPHLSGLLIDLQFSYDKSEVLAILHSIGEQGRATYVWANWIDNIFPLTYGVFFTGFLYRFGPAGKGALLALIPLALAVTDILETAQIGVMVRSFPDIGETQALVSSVFSSVKRVLLTATMLLFLGTAVMAAVRMVSARKS